MQPSVADWITAASTALYTLLTLGLLVAALVAWRTARHALEASRKASEAALQAADEAKRANIQSALDSVQRTRPYVFVELLPGLQGQGCYDLRIANIGRSAARSLLLSLEHWPDASDAVTDSVRTLFTRSRTLPPGSSIRAIWRIEDGASGADSSSLGMPTEATVKVDYTSDDPAKPTYTDVFEVSTKTSGLWPVPEDGVAADDLEGMERTFYLLGQALVRRVGELGR